MVKKKRKENKITLQTDVTFQIKTRNPKVYRLGSSPFHFEMENLQFKARII